MRRRTKVSTEAASGKIDNEQNFWPSYADMMSSFALILFFLMLLSYLSNIQTGNNLRNTE
jgi:chemotaxis protein MotB